MELSIVGGQQAYAEQAAIRSAAMQHDGFVDWVGVGGGRQRIGEMNELEGRQQQI